ncbi:MAG TPA: hypothetical protein VGE69_05115 [Pseudomonadales bacterium]
MHRHTTPRYCALALLLASGGGHAAEPEGFSLELDAYGTLGAVHSSEDDADFIADLKQPDGAGFHDDVALGIDSRVGLQLTATFTPRLSSVVQVISEHQHDGTFSPIVEWANVKYEVTPEFSLRAGRIVLPILMTSEYRKVGYANHWVRAPVEVYHLLPVTNNDGVDISYRIPFGDHGYTLLAYYGSNDARLPSGKVEGDGSRGIINTLEFGPTLLRLGFTYSGLQAGALNGFFDLFRGFGPQGQALAARYDLNDKAAKSIVLGLNHDPGPWFAMAEWIRIETDSFIGTNRAWYVSSGVRLGRATPYITYSRKDSVEDFSRERGLDIAGLPPPLQDFGMGLNAGLAGFLRPTDSATVSAGTRWDFAGHFSFTLQVDHVHADDDSFGMVANRQPGLMPGGRTNVATASFSFVY